jgi:hypothetical protein
LQWPQEARQTLGFHLNGAIAMSKVFSFIGVMFLVAPFTPALAQAPDAFLVVSQATGRCLGLTSPEQPDGGRLVMRDCAKRPEVHISTATRSTPYMFFLPGKKILCISATETPDIRPDGSKHAVRTEDCSTSFSVPSLWTPRPLRLDGTPVQVEKGRRFGSAVDSTGFCIQENIDTSEVELDVCQDIPKQQWMHKKL